MEREAAERAFAEVADWPTRATTPKERGCRARTGRRPRSYAAAFLHAECLRMRAMSVQVLYQLTNQVAFMLGRALVEMVQRTVPLAAARQRAGVAEQNQTRGGPRQGLGKRPRMIGVGDGPMRVAARQAHQGEQTFAVRNAEGDRPRR